MDRFLMLSPFARDYFAEHTDIPGSKMRFKPNAVPDLGLGGGAGGYALFAGRLAEEKGIDVLLEAARLGIGLPLKIVGQGPLETRVKQAHAAGHVEYLGPQTPDQVCALMQQAAFLLVPSLWYECLPLVIIEAFATGTPVIASNIGSLATLVDHEQTGLLFNPGDAAELAAAYRRLAANETLRAKMRILARKQYEMSYQPANNLALLSSVYQELLPALAR